MNILRRLWGRTRDPLRDSPEAHLGAALHTCSICGRSSPGTARFCPECGTEFKVELDRYDVFISYRREGGGDVATVLYLSLKQYKTVFMDVDELQTGRFDEKLLGFIERSTHFVLILNPGCLDRCVDKSDWLKREIVHALETRRNIIPVMLPNFRFPDAAFFRQLPDVMAPLSTYNAVSYDHEKRDAAIRKILTFMSCAQAAVDLQAARLSPDQRETTPDPGPEPWTASGECRGEPSPQTGSAAIVETGPPRADAGVTRTVEAEAAGSTGATPDRAVQGQDSAEVQTKENEAQQQQQARDGESKVDRAAGRDAENAMVEPRGPSPALPGSQATEIRLGTIFVRNASGTTVRARVALDRERPCLGAVRIESRSTRMAAETMPPAASAEDGSEAALGASPGHIRGPASPLMASGPCLGAIRLVRKHPLPDGMVPSCAFPRTDAVQLGSIHVVRKELPCNPVRSTS